MAYAVCTHCGWDLAQPGLSEAFLGTQECLNCGQGRPLEMTERVETMHAFDQRLHLCERELAALKAEKA